ncbi:MAG: 30S ribosomal protein S1 [Planctomycetota bacterium]
MPNLVLLEDHGVDVRDIEQEIDAILGSPSDVDRLHEQAVTPFAVGKIVKGRVLHVSDTEIVVDVGYKSEALLERFEWGEGEVKEGDEVEVLVEQIDDMAGLISISKQRADRIRGWERIVSEKREGDTVRGKVVKKIKGGLLVDIGVPVFLPASQIAIRRVPDIGEFVGQEIECKVLKVDSERRNIVVSRRRLLEEQREKQKKDLLDSIQPGEIRVGEVKNLADFGAFIDLGGIDGLLHITDMAWGRIGHPSEMLQVGQRLEVMVLDVDRAKEKISLGLKQKGASPWEHVEGKYPVGTRVKGKVVNIVSYGSFVKLEDGIEGLVHISEMSWTKRINHPTEVVKIGDEAEVVILGINREKQEISLGMKQAGVNPWTQVKEKYPVGTRVKGKIRNLTSYGAFVEIEEGIDGLLHVSDMSWTKKVAQPSEVVKKSVEVECIVLSVDPEKKRIALGLKQLQENPWETSIPEKFPVRSIVTGTVTKITNFGVFVELEPGLEGLLHISELSDRKVDKPEEVVKVGDVVDVRILRVDPDERKIGLSLKKTKGPAPAATTRKRQEDEPPL